MATNVYEATNPTGEYASRCICRQRTDAAIAGDELSLYTKILAEAFGYGQCAAQRCLAPVDSS